MDTKERSKGGTSENQIFSKQQAQFIMVTLLESESFKKQIETI